MKKTILILLIGVICLSSCEKEADTTMDNTSNTTNCGWYNGKPTYEGPNGGCYYINSNGNKTYVDHQYCPC